MYVHWIDKNKVSHSVKCSNKDTAKMLYQELKDYKAKMQSNNPDPLWKVTKYTLLAV
ncbi:hypothetical protein [Oceanobacillus oncorhynchi]|uniref:hypothetical protein n=1 Tax=Oceanobacillus oncorhynchi TaxID=545501 RepID=UPI0034D43379